MTGLVLTAGMVGYTGTTVVVLPPGVGSEENKSNRSTCITRSTGKDERVGYNC